MKVGPDHVRRGGQFKKVSHDRQAVSAADAVFEVRAGNLIGRHDGVANSFGLEFPVTGKLDDERTGLGVERVISFGERRL